MNGNTLIVPISDFIRRVKYYEDLLPAVSGISLTRDGWSYMDVKLSNQARNRLLLKSAGAWEGTILDSDKLWNEVLSKRVNRRKPIKL
jgi:hypothetical protein